MEALGRKLYEDELDSRMETMGLGSDTNESTRTQELRYWRKKVCMEEDSAVKQAGMLLSLLSSFVESFTNAVGFTTIRTQGLSEAIQTALEAGDFDLAIKSYCVSPQALLMLQNPGTSFLTSFGHVVLRTHIDNMKRELSAGIAKSQPAAEPLTGFRTQLSQMVPMLQAVKQAVTGKLTPDLEQPGQLQFA